MKVSNKLVKLVRGMIVGGAIGLGVGAGVGLFCDYHAQSSNINIIKAEIGCFDKDNSSYVFDKDNNIIVDYPFKYTKTMGITLGGLGALIGCGLGSMLPRTNYYSRSSGYPGPGLGGNHYHPWDDGCTNFE